jgi:hypothetical protein
MHWKLLRHFMTGACRGRPLVAPHALQGADRERRGRRVPVAGERYAEPGPQPRKGLFQYRSAATCAPHHGQQSREVIVLSAAGQLGMAAPGPIQLTVVTSQRHAPAEQINRDTINPPPGQLQRPDTKQSN